MAVLPPLLGAASNIHEVFHGYMNSSPMRASSSTEHLDILGSPMDQEMLLSGLAGIPSSSCPMDFNCDEWALPSEGNFTQWRLHEFQDPSNLPAQQHPAVQTLTADTAANVAASAAVANPNASKSRLSWCKEKETNKVIKSASLSPSLPSKRKSSPLSSKRHDGFKRPASGNDLLKQSDSSDNSDARDDDDDDGDKLISNGKAPMSKNLVSERRRRKKLNERLYSLRAIVPTISKMDKASIVGDAISYVQDLQRQVEDMQTDIRTLQSSRDGNGLPDSANNGMASMLPSTKLPDHKILELDVSKMEEFTYHLRIHCKKGPGVLVQLTRALEALDFEIVNAILTSVSDHILNTIVLKMKNGEMLEPEELREMVLRMASKFGLSM